MGKTTAVARLVAVVASFVLCAIGRVSADGFANVAGAGASFSSASGTSRAVLGKDGTVFTLFTNGRQRYVSSPPHPLSFGRLWVSEDGRYVTWMLAERFYATVGRRASSGQVPALIFYVDGKEVKHYSLTELLVRPQLVSVSTSHTQWIAETRNADWSPGPPGVVFAGDGKRLTLETTSMRRYVFDPTTGSMLEAGDTALYTKADLIVYGECRPEGPGRVRLARFRSVKGAVTAQESIVFSDATGSFDQGWHTVALARDGAGWTAIAPAHALPIVFNVLPTAE
jgi:hypothetical protein